MSLAHRVRRLAFLSATTLAVVACGGAVSSSASVAVTASDAPASTSPVTPSLAVSPGTASEAPTATPSAGPAEADLDTATATLEEIDTYALSVRVSGLIETASGADEVTMNGLFDGPADAYRLQISGMAELQEIGGGSAVDIIVIGPDAWISTGGGAFIETPGGATVFESMGAAFLPTTLLGWVPAGALRDLPPAAIEQKNGMTALHYRVTGPDALVLADELGPDAVVDLWIARDGGFLVSTAVEGVADVDGTATPIRFTIDVSRIDDPSIEVAPPR